MTPAVNTRTTLTWSMRPSTRASRCIWRRKIAVGRELAVQRLQDEAPADRGVFDVVDAAHPAERENAHHAKPATADHVAWSERRHEPRSTACATSCVKPSQRRPEPVTSARTSSGRRRACRALLSPRTKRVSAWKIGARTFWRSVHATISGMSSTASTRRPADATAFVERRALGERRADLHLGSLLLRDAREQVSVTREPEQRALFAARRRPRCATLLHAARDDRRDEPRAHVERLRVSDAERETSDERARPLERRANRRVEYTRHVRQPNAAVAARFTSSYARAAHEHAGFAREQIFGERGPAERADATRRRLATDDVGDRDEIGSGARGRGRRARSRWRPST